MKRSEDAADQAEVIKQALMIEGRALTPAFFILAHFSLLECKTGGDTAYAMTNGEAAAVPFSPFASAGSFEGTSKPMMAVPPI